MKYYPVQMLVIFQLWLLPIVSHAWNALGHMVVANIAYQNLEPNVKKKIDNIVSYFSLEYPGMASFLQMAYWPDTLHAQKIETFTHWHYIDIPFSQDGSPLKNIMDTDNIVWAIINIEPIIKYNHTNPYELARFLAFLIHIVGDIHQPLHTVSYISVAYPNGDQGGNLYFIRYNNERIKLHRLWDSGLGMFDQSATQENADILTAIILKHYPKTYVYVPPADQTPSADYLETGRKISEREIALAGYRLGTFLNKILS